MRMRRALSCRLAAVAGVLATPVIALAQTAPSEPNLPRTPAAWLGYVVMFILLACVLGVSLMPSKRGHQD